MIETSRTKHRLVLSEAPSRAGVTVLYTPESSLVRSLSYRGPVSLYAAVRIIWTAMWFPAFDGVIADPLTLLQTQKRMGRPVVVNVLFLDANPKRD